MELNNIIILFSSLFALVVFVLLWFGFAVKGRYRDEYEKSVLELKDEKNEILQRVDELKSILEQKNIAIAQLDKDLENRDGKIDDLAHQLLISQEKTEELTMQISDFRAKNSQLEAQLAAQKEGNEKLKEDFEGQGKKLEMKVNEIMQQLLETKLKKFDDSSMKSLENLLKPFKENLDIFKQKVENSQEHSTKKFAELSKEIEQITKMSLDIGKEARSLTEALKGKKQTQGRWGEMILESVLEFSGLVKGKHYETQESYRDDNGNIKRPDVIVKLPQDRTIIIDSKVSLNDYDRYVKAQDDAQREICAKAMVGAFKNHIKTLDSKDYTEYKSGTLQYIFMFVPIEGAFALAVQEDPSLYEYALDRHIAIVTPSTLTVSLRTIYLYWQSEQSTSNALKIFEVAGKLYDKMVGFTQNFDKIGTQLQTLNGSYENAKSQLATGGGNLMKRTEELKTLGAKTIKSLKNSKITYTDFDDEEDVHVEFIEEKK